MKIKHLNKYLDEYKIMTDMYIRDDESLRKDFTDLGRELKLIINQNVLTQSEIQSISDCIYIKLFIIKGLMINGNLFNDFIDSLLLFINYMLIYFEKNEEYEVCINIKNLNKELNYLNFKTI